MVRFLIFLVGMLTTNRPGGMRTVPLRRDDSFGRADLPEPDEEGADDGDTWYLPPQSPPPQRPNREAGRAPVRLERGHGRTRRRSIRRKLTWAAVLVLAGLLLRKVIAWAALVALSATLHLFGFNVRLPHIKLAWPWQAISAGTTTDTNIGPWVLQKIEGISRPALGTENFNFTFTHKVSKNIGIWPCWYSSTFAAVGHASATVDLNPGSAWWTPGVWPLPAAGPQPPGDGHARPGQRQHRPARATATAVRSRRHGRQHAVASDRRAAQLDLSRARLRRADSAAVFGVGAVWPGAESRVRSGHAKPADYRSADKHGRGSGGTDCPE